MTVRAIAGLFVLNLAYSCVGASLMWGFRGWRRWLEPIRLAGVAYFIGLAAFVVVMTAEIVVGIPFGLLTMLVTGSLLTAFGLSLGVLRKRRFPRLSWARWRLPHPSIFVALMAAGIVLWLEASFRAARLQPPWLIDAWRVWTVRAKLLFFEGGFQHVDLGASLNAYPTGLSLLQAQAFEAMGLADAVTLHLQHWFFALGFVAATFGLLARRVRAGILAPVLLLTLVMPAFADLSIWPLADPLLAYLAAVAALLLCLWLEDAARWRLEAAVVLLAAAVLIKREALIVVMCLYLAAAVSAWARRRSSWPQLGVAALVTVLLSASWRIGLIAAGRSDAPTAGYLSFLDTPARGADSLRLVASTYVGSQWGLPMLLTLTALVLALVVRTRSTPTFVGAFLLASLVTSSFVIWAEPFFRISQYLTQSPVVRMTLVVVVVTCPLSALMLEDVWRATAPARADDNHGAVATRSTWGVAGWGVLVVAALAYPVSALFGIAGPTLPGGRPIFPNPPVGWSQVLVTGEQSLVVSGSAASVPTAAGSRTQLNMWPGCNGSSKIPVRERGRRRFVRAPAESPALRDAQLVACVEFGTGAVSSPSRTTSVTTKLGRPFASS